ncbi:hypothetical protein [Novosphingobium naphthalenivorans]|uniref:hypothetical protein n=1 Tax=Novosphingobium naphthalenivorans TaxID=273168 RepID=UPI0008365E36|nr:hypothetical protein [Novosphingobium naphthalenivorans]
MEIAIRKGARDDRIEILREDGSSVVTRFPKKGPVPHDAVHYFVEQGLGLTQGFWGMVADGRHPEDLAELANEHGHASASRAVVPGMAIVQLLQAERLVECFEADLWVGGGDDQALLALAATACASSYVPLPQIAEDALMEIRDSLSQFACNWMDANEGHVARLSWPEPAQGSEGRKN